MRLRIAFLASLLVASGHFLAGCGGADPAPPSEPSFEERFGIRVESVRLAAAGGMIDVRYRVSDPQKAAAFQKRSTLPHLLSEATGLRLFVPSFSKAGPMRQAPREAVAGQVYFLLFRNVGDTLQPHDRVVLEMGDRRSDAYEVL